MEKLSENSQITRKTLCFCKDNLQTEPTNCPTLYDKSQLPPPPPCGELLTNKLQEVKTQKFGSGTSKNDQTIEETLDNLPTNEQPSDPNDTSKSKLPTIPDNSQQRHKILYWKYKLECALAAITDEIEILDSDRERLKTAYIALKTPEMIVEECLERRTSRLDGALAQDNVEKELMKERSLIADIRDLFKQILAEINLQNNENKTIKQRLEFDWSDKKVSYEINSPNGSLNNRSNRIMFRSDAARFHDNQSDVGHWENFTRDLLAEFERIRQKSMAIRSNLDVTLINSARDLRCQADCVESALTIRISFVDEARDALETELKNILKSIANMEKVFDELCDFDRKLTQYGLMDEIKSTTEQVATIKAKLTQTKEQLDALISKRFETESKIMRLRESLEIDRQRISKLRAFYPSIVALMGRV